MPRNPPAAPLDVGAPGCAGGAPPEKENAVVMIVAGRRASRPSGAARPAESRRSTRGAGWNQNKSGVAYLRAACIGRGWACRGRLLRGEVGDAFSCRES